MVHTTVEYQAFTAAKTAREYHLRVRRGTEHQYDLTVAIPNEAFLFGRVRYQDAPDICFAKVQREMAACGQDGIPAASFTMTDQELDEYRVAHTPRNPGRRF